MEFKEILNYELSEMFKDETYLKIKSALNKEFKQFILLDDTKEMIYEFVEENMLQVEKENKTIKELFPKGFENSLKVLVFNKGPEIMESIKKFINDDKFKIKVKEEIRKFLSGMNPMVAKFVNVDTIYKRIMNFTVSYTDNTENMMNIINAVNEEIDKNSYRNITEFTNYIPYEGKKSFVRLFVDEYLKSIVGSSLIEGIENQFEKKLLSYGTLGEIIKIQGE